jgi:hypothetical protein
MLTRLCFMISTPLHPQHNRLPLLHPPPHIQPLLSARRPRDPAALLPPQLRLDRAARLVLDKTVPHPDGHLGV